MQSLPLLVLVLPIVLAANLPTVVGDCYNKQNYNNCATCYQTFANALVDTGDNKYRLSKAFFPTDSAVSVHVKVTYKDSSNITDNKIYFWITGGFYIIQPIEVFLYRSLFFSPPKYRAKSVNVTLPNECFGAIPNPNDTTELANEEFFEYATQRLKGYAQSQSNTPAIDSSYMGMAVRGRNAKVRYYVGDGDVIVALAYSLPFFFIFVAFILFFVVTCVFTPLSKLEESIKDDPKWQANTAAVLLLCVAFSIYSFALDVVSWDIESKHNDLPSYYKQLKHFVNITYAYTFFYFLVLIIALVFILCEVIRILCSLKKQKPISSDGAREGSDNLPSQQTETSLVKKIYTKRITLISVLIAGSAILSFIAHSPSILMAWATDSFYASRIALFYGIIIFIYFTVFRFAYSALKGAFDEVIKNDKCKHYGQYKCCAQVVIFSIIIVLTIFVTGIVVVMTLFVVTVPVNNSIETASEGVTSIYNGAVVLIGVLLAYKIGWHNTGRSFSVSNALKKAMDIKITSNKNKNELIDQWKILDEEKRLTEVMKAIIINEKYIKQIKINLGYTEEGSGECSSHLVVSSREHEDPFNYVSVVWSAPAQDGDNGIQLTERETST